LDAPDHRLRGGAGRNVGGPSKVWQQLRRGGPTTEAASCRPNPKGEGSRHDLDDLPAGAGVTYPGWPAAVVSQSGHRPEPQVWPGPRAGMPPEVV